MEEEQVVKLTPEQEEAAMMAGFDGTDVEPVPQEKTTEPEATPEAEPEPEQQPQPEAPKTLTHDDVRAAVEAALQVERSERQKLHDRVFGKVGELGQKLEEAKKQTSTFSPAAWGKLKENFPELYDMLADGQDLTKAPEPAAPAIPQLPPVDVDAIVASKLAEKDREIQEELMDVSHPDWRDLPATPEFSAWRETLSPEAAANLATTVKARDLVKHFTAFKTWRAEQTTVQQTEAQKRAEQEKLNKERLESAATPQGRSRPRTAIDDDEEAALLAAYSGSSR